MTPRRRPRYDDPTSLYHFVMGLLLAVVVCGSVWAFVAVVVMGMVRSWQGR